MPTRPATKSSDPFAEFADPVQPAKPGSFEADLNEIRAGSGRASGGDWFKRNKPDWFDQNAPQKGRGANRTFAQDLEDVRRGVGVPAVGQDVTHLMTPQVGDDVTHL